MVIVAVVFIRYNLSVWHLDWSTSKAFFGLSVGGIGLLAWVLAFPFRNR